MKKIAKLSLIPTLAATFLVPGVFAGVPAAAPEAVSAKAVEKSPETTSAVNGHFINSLLWSQQSGEARALYYQAFNLADMLLENDLADKSVTKKRAIIVDVDETVLSNSPYMARLALEGKDPLTAYWYEWVDNAEAKAVPGAVEFLNKAAEKGVDIFYISNRPLANIPGTMKNLKKEGFPQVEKSHILFKDQENSKEPRRQKVEETHHVVLLMGDTLIDFSDALEKPNNKDRQKAVDEYKEKFGRSFIVLPNPMYGYWLNNLHKNYNTLTQEQKEEVRIQSLDAWKRKGEKGPVAQ
ncbi:MAG: 5'-nucleotidase, lipoprotein e(P4) family [Bacillota bacterium]